MVQFTLRAVVSSYDISNGELGYVVSLSKSSDEHGIEVVGEKQVDSLGAAEEFIEQIAEQQNYASKKIDRLYNLNGKITTKAPRRRN